MADRTLTRSASEREKYRAEVERLTKDPEARELAFHQELRERVRTAVGFIIGLSAATAALHFEAGPLRTFMFVMGAAMVVSAGYATREMTRIGAPLEEAEAELRKARGEPTE